MILGVDLELWATVVTVTLGLLLLIILWMWIRLSRMKKRYYQFIGKGKDSLESIILEMKEKLERAEVQQKELIAHLLKVEQEAGKLKGHVEMVRYNPFPGQGSDMSFSIAFLDNERNGLVLTGLTSRQETYVYAKPIHQGESPYALSEEEQKVMDLVMEKKDKQT